MSQPLFELPAQEQPTPITDAVAAYLHTLDCEGLLVGPVGVAAEVALNLGRRIDAGAKDYAVAALSAQLSEWLAQLPKPAAQEQAGPALADLLRALPAVS